MIMSLAQQAQNAGESQYLIWAGALFAIAIVLLFLELFIPSGGMIGVLAAIAAIGSLVAFFKYDTTWGFAMTLAYIILAPIAIIGIFKLWLNSPIARRMILGGRDDGAAASNDENASTAEQARHERNNVLRQLIGAEGVTITSLRPVGTVRINDQRVDALAETGVIDADVRVVVTDIYDNQIKVRPR